MKSLPLAVPHMSEAEAEEVFGWILDGEATDQEIARFLLAMTERSETADEIAGAARALRARYIPVDGPDNAIDWWPWRPPPAGCRWRGMATGPSPRFRAWLTRWRCWASIWKPPDARRKRR